MSSPHVSDSQVPFSWPIPSARLQTCASNCSIGPSLREVPDTTKQLCWNLLLLPIPLPNFPTRAEGNPFLTQNSIFKTCLEYTHFSSQLFAQTSPHNSCLDYWNYLLLTPRASIPPHPIPIGFLLDSSRINYGFSSLSLPTSLEHASPPFTIWTIPHVWSLTPQQLTLYTFPETSLSGPLGFSTATSSLHKLLPTKAETGSLLHFIVPRIHAHSKVLDILVGFSCFRISCLSLRTMCLVPKRFWKSTPSRLAFPTNSLKPERSFVTPFSSVI